MNASYWTLEHVEGLVTKTFEQWSIEESSVTRELRSLNADTMSFDALVDFDSNPAFNVGDSIIIRKGGVGFFRGIIVRNDRVGQPDKEHIHYELAGPWWYLDNRIYQTPWRISSGEQEDRGRVIVFQTISGGRFETGAQIQEIIYFILARGAPFSLGAIPNGTAPPFEEVNDQTCGELIRHVLRWTPDVTSWFDYTLSPPKLNFAGRETAPVVAHTIGQELKVLSCTPRHDLQIPGVIAIFERTDTITIDGVTETKSKTVSQIAGVDTWGTLVFTIALSGSSQSFQTQFVQRKEFDLRQLDFWKEKHPELVMATGPDGTGQPVIEVSETSAFQDPRPANSLFGYDGAELVGGAIPQWLESRVYSTTCKAKISYQLVDDNGGKVVHTSRPFAVQIQATSLGGHYSSLVSETEGEDIPPELANAIFASTSALQWQGQVVFETAEVSGLLHPGHLLNIFGGRTEWETMLAQIQTVSENIGSGTTSVVFGPPGHLGPQDFLALQRMNRNRNQTFKLQERLDSIVRVTGSSVGPAGSANTSATAAFTAPSKMEMAEKPTVNESKIILNVTDIPQEVRQFIGELKHMKVREIAICNKDAPEDDQQGWFIGVLATTPYKKST